MQTNFEFFSGKTDLNVTHQFIIKNGGVFYNFSNISGSSYGYGGGYESFHLEFETSQNLSNEIDRDSYSAYKITFTDSIYRILAVIPFDEYKVVFYSNPDIPDSPVFYSVDLIDVPLSILDQTKKIYIVTVSRR